MIRYTLDGSDPRDGGALGGGDAHSVTVGATMQIKARILDGATWSALRELLVILPQDFSALRLSEVMYHPAPELAAESVAILNIVGDADLGRARIDLGSPPPGDLGDGDYIRVYGSLPTNNGVFQIADVDGNSLFIKVTLSDDASMPAACDLLYDGDRYEFVELENSGGTPLKLGAVEFSKGISFSFDPNFSLAAGARAVIATRPWDFAYRYPAVPLIGEFLRDLDNGGETLELAQTDQISHDVTALEPSGVISFAALPPAAAVGNRIRITGCERVTNNGSYRILAVNGNTVTVSKAFVAAPGGAYAQLFEVIDSIDYDDSDPWPRAADGLGYSLVREGAAWRASSAAGGSPGTGDTAPLLHPPLLVNEALTHTDLPQVDAVEIHNPTGAAVALAGWSLTDDLDEPSKFRFAAGSIPAGGYAVFTEDDFGAVFRLGADGDSIHLLSPDLRYSHGFEFGPSENGVSFGRHLTSTTAEHFVRQAAKTLGGANAGPRAGPVVISEIHYHPIAGSYEFLELTNTSPSPLDLSGWSVGGIGFSFPAGTMHRPGEVLLLVENPAAAASAPAGTQRFVYTASYPTAASGSACAIRTGPRSMRWTTMTSRHGRPQLTAAVLR